RPGARAADRGLGGVGRLAGGRGRGVARARRASGVARRVRGLRGLGRRGRAACGARVAVGGLGGPRGVGSTAALEALGAVEAAALLVASAHPASPPEASVRSRYDSRISTAAASSSRPFSWRRVRGSAEPPT